MFWNKFLELCNKNNISPNAVGKEIGLSSASITYWKNGSKPRDTAIMKICDYFGLPYDYFDSQNSSCEQILSYNGNTHKTIELPDDITDDDLKLIEFVLEKYKNKA